MNCSFCHQTSDDLQCVNALMLCPDCLNQLLRVSPDDREYAWFVSAVRRALGCSAREAKPSSPERGFSMER